MTDYEPDELDLLHLSAARARRRLIEAPGLIAWVRMQVTPNMGGAQDGMPRAASKEAPLPLRADAVDDSDDAFSRLLYWVAYWAALYEEAPPLGIQGHWQVQGEAQGFRATVTPEGAGGLVHLATLWLLTRHDRIMLHETGPDYFDDVADIVHQLHARYPRAPRGQRGVLERACPVCDQFTFGAEWPDDAPVDAFVLRCSHCGHTEEAAAFIKAGRVRELLHELREEHADPKSEWWTKKQAARELDITPRTLDRYISDGLAVYTAGGTVHVNVEDLLEVYRGKKLAKKEVDATP